MKATKYNVFILLEDGNWECIAQDATQADIICLEMEHPTRNLTSILTTTPQILEDGTFMEILK